MFNAEVVVQTESVDKAIAVLGRLLPALADGENVLIKQDAGKFRVVRFRDDMAVAVVLTATMPPDLYSTFIERARPIMKLVQQKTGE